MARRRDESSQYRPRRELGVRFEAASVAELYGHRPPYSEEVYALVEDLAPERGGRVLDCGTGTGKMARELAARGFQVDAVDPSAEMLRVGRSLPHGDAAGLQWILGSIEEAALSGGYALAVAGASFHWFDADRVLPRLSALLEPDAVLVVLDGDRAWRAPWEEAEDEIMIDFVTRMQGRPPVWHRIEIEDARILEHPCFEPRGEHVTAPDPVRQRVDDYVACQHSRATFTHEVMGRELARDFDAALRGVLEGHAEAGWLTYACRTRLEWGRPQPG